MKHPIFLTVARILLSSIFLKAAIGHIVDMGGMQQAIISQGVPGFLAGAMAIGGLVLLVGGGLSLLVGYQTRWGAVLLILFLIPATLMFHRNFADPMQQIQFFKNLSLIGGLMLVMQTGAGHWSLDHKINRPKYKVLKIGSQDRF